MASVMVYDRRLPEVSKKTRIEPSGEMSEGFDCWALAVRETKARARVEMHIFIGVILLRCF